MTTREAIYKTALEHIRDEGDAVCPECGWMGRFDETLYQKESEVPSFLCPSCRSEKVGLGENKIAAYALAQAEKVEL